MRTNYWSLTTVIALIIFFAVQETKSIPSPGLDVNDVSILIPMGPHGLHPSINLNHLGVIDTEIFEQVLRFEYPSGTPGSPSLEDLPYVDSRFVTDINRWKLTSFRIEDCGEVVQSHLEGIAGSPPTWLIERSPGCQPRLRLVAQPFNLFGIPLPTAMHFLINLEANEFQQFTLALKSLQELGRSRHSTETTGKALALHPGLRAELQVAGDTTLADHVQATLANIVKRNWNSLTSNSVDKFPQTESVTLILQTEINHWKFAGGLVRNGRWLKSETTFSRQFRQETSYAALGVEDLKCDIHSSCTLSPDPSLIQEPLRPDGRTLSWIFHDDIQFAQEQVPGRRSKRALETAELIDLPSATHFFNTTCVSCHQSSNLRDPSRRHLPTLTPEGLTPFVEKTYSSPFTNNVLNFAYFGASPKVSTRTAAESLDIAQRINRQQGWQNPASKIPNLEDFWKCLRNENDSTKCY